MYHITIKQYRYCGHGERIIDEPCLKYFTYCIVYITPNVLVRTTPERAVHINSQIARVLMGSAVRLRALHASLH